MQMCFHKMIQYKTKIYHDANIDCDCEERHEKCIKCGKKSYHKVYAYGKSNRIKGGTGK